MTAEIIELCIQKDLFCELYENVSQLYTEMRLSLMYVQDVLVVFI